jgi:hypothetical protein
MLCPPPSVKADTEFEKYAYVVTVGGAPEPNTHAVLTTTVGLPVATPFEIRLKFTRPGDAATEIESPRIAVKFTPAMLDRTCAFASDANALKATAANSTAQASRHRPCLLRRDSECTAASRRIPNLLVPISVVPFDSRVISGRLRKCARRPTQAASPGIVQLRLRPISQHLRKLQRLRLDIQHAGICARRQVQAGGIDLQSQRVSLRRVHVRRADAGAENLHSGREAVERVGG